MNEFTSFNEIIIIVSEKLLTVIDRNKIQITIDTEILKFTKVLFVSNLALNLISVSQLNLKENSVVFNAKNVSKTFMFNEKVIAHVNKIFN